MHGDLLWQQQKTKTVSHSTLMPLICPIRTTNRRGADKFNFTKYPKTENMMNVR